MLARRMPWLFVPLAFGCEGELPEVNIFSIEDDKQLGAQLADEIANNPDAYGVILDEKEYAEAYDHLNGLRDAILSSGEVIYEKEFEWKTHIIHDDSVLNAFAAPGGYIYVYTGLVRYLDTEDQLAGVMGHEIAHADRRHSTQQLTKAYGIDTLLNVLFDEPGVIGQVATGLVGLTFSREDESEADEFSVIYLCETDYASNGAAGFFELLLEEGDDAGIPEFLSTHPSSSSRVTDINAEADTRGCSTEANPNAHWKAFVNSLPPADKGGGKG